MCQMEINYMCSNSKAVSINLNDSWAGNPWDATHSSQQERARFQQKQLQEKEEKLLKLYEDQQERALKSVGSVSQSGGSSVSSSSSVGVGKVRHMFLTRRGNSDSRLGATITGRDKSYPLKPLTKYPSARNLDSDHGQRFTTSQNWEPNSHNRSLSLDRNNRDSFGKNDRFFDLDENYNRRNIGVRRTQSQARNPRPKLDNRQSFQLVDDFEPEYPEYDYADDYFLNTVKARRQYESQENNLVENRIRGEPREKMEGKYKSYVSQNAFNKKPHLGSATVATRNGVAGKQVSEVKETNSTGYLKGSASSPIRKIRKPTPVPLSVAPPQHLLQKDLRKPRVETIREVPTSVSSPRAAAGRTQSSTGTAQKPPTSGRSLPSARVTPKTSFLPPSTPRSAPSSDLVNCRICGRHFAADRVSKHEEVCQKSSRTKRKPFDALQQRVKGTEVEQFIRKSSKTSRTQPEKVAKPQSNWRKKHEEFINNIRAAKEVSAHLKKGGKLSDLPPPPPSDYSDYVPCPHCGRKFSSSAAERHIPKCVNIINNKPKTKVQGNAGLKQSPKLLHSASPSVRGRK